MFGDNFTNDCYKSYGLDWDLEAMLAYIAKMEEDDYYRSCAKLDYEIQKMLQEMFPDLDRILVDISW